MKSMDGAKSVSVGGQQYEVINGIVEVPAGHENMMYSFGFITIGKNEPVELEENVLIPEAVSVKSKKK